MLASVGVARVLTMDLHADQIQGFFDIPVDNIYAAPVLLGDVWKQRYEDLIVVSPDVGGVVRARALAKRLESDLAIIDKRRPKANVSEVMNVIGEVKGRTCVIMDDMVDTAGTLVKAAQVLKEEGATRVRRLLHARGAFGRRGRAHREVGPRRAGGHRHHPAARGRARLPRRSASYGRGAARRDHPAHLHRGIGELAVHGMSIWSKSQHGKSKSARASANVQGTERQPPAAPRAACPASSTAATEAALNIELDHKALSLSLRNERSTPRSSR